jgi:hypothetical protein
MKTSMNKANELNILKQKLLQKEKLLSENMRYNNIEFDSLSDTEDTDEKLYCKIGSKGTICVYGLHKKLPVSLKPEQWEKLYQFMLNKELHKFIKENEEKLNK